MEGLAILVLVAFTEGNLLQGRLSKKQLNKTGRAKMLKPKLEKVLIFWKKHAKLLLPALTNKTPSGERR